MCEIDSKLVFDKPVVLMGGAHVRESTLRSDELKELPVVAADGGANTLFNYGITPAAIIGDLDSLEQIDYWQQQSRVMHIAEQDTTDFEKCLYTVSAPLLVAVGFTGKRFDHTLVTLHLLQKYVGKVKLLLITDEDVCFAWQGDLHLTLPLGCRFSIYPLTETTFINSTGLEYSLDGLTLKQGKVIGTSNRVAHSNIVLNAKPEGIYTVILSLSVLDTLLGHFGDL